MLCYDKIKDYAASAGFDLCGVAPCRTLKEHEVWFGEWLSRGYHGGMEYMRRNSGRRFDPAGLVDGARSVVVCAVSYNYGIAPLVERLPAPRMASYAFARDYHAVLKEMLHRLLSAVKRDEPEVSGRCFVDTAPLLEKAWAVEAGLGWIGKNSLLLTPRHGSFVLLGEIVVDAVFDRYDAPYAGDGCGECRRCIDGCPAGAIPAPRVVDARRCISRLTVERMADGGRGGDNSGNDLHGWIYGCDACQNVCPYNLRALPASCTGLRPVIQPDLLTADFWKNLTEDKFEEIFGSTPLARYGLGSIRRDR